MRGRGTTASSGPLANRRTYRAEYAHVDTRGPSARDVVTASTCRSEKVYASFTRRRRTRRFTARCAQARNAIYACGALLRVAPRLPSRDPEISRVLFEQMAPISGANANDCAPWRSSRPDDAAAARLSRSTPLHAILRTTCVAIDAQGGHSENACPKTAQETGNCRSFRQGSSGSPADAGRVVADKG